MFNPEENTAANGYTCASSAVTTQSTRQLSPYDEHLTGDVDWPHPCLGGRRTQPISRTLEVLNEERPILISDDNESQHDVLELTKSDDLSSSLCAFTTENKIRKLEIKLQNILMDAEDHFTGEKDSPIFLSAVQVQQSIHQLHLHKMNCSISLQKNQLPSPTSVSQLDFEVQNKLHSFEASPSTYHSDKLVVDASHILSLCSILLKQGALYLRCKDHTAAIKIFSEVRQILQDFINHETTCWRRQCDSKCALRIDWTIRVHLESYLSSAWNNLGYSFYTTHRHREALLAYQESYQIKIKILRFQHNMMPSQVVKKDSDKLVDQSQYNASTLAELEIGSILHNIGLVHHATSKYSLAIDSFKEAVNRKSQALEQISNVNEPSTSMALQIKQDIEIRFANTLLCYGCTLSNECHWISDRRNETIKSISRDFQASDCGGFEHSNQEHGRFKKELEESIKKYTDHLIYNQEKALQLYKQALPILQRTLNPNDDAIAVAFYNIGLAELQLGRNKTATEAFENARQIQECHAVRKRTAFTGIILFTLGLSFLGTENFEDAIRIFTEALHITKTASENSENGQPNLPLSKEGDVYFSSPFLHYNLFEAACRGDVKSIVSEASVLFHLAKAYYFTHDYESAMKCYLQVVKDRVASLGTFMHESVASVISSIADVMMKKSAYSVAVKGYNESLRIQVECLGPFHENIADEYTKLAMLYMGLSTQNPKKPDAGSSDHNDEKMSQDLGQLQQPFDEETDRKCNSSGALSLKFCEKACEIYRINRKHCKLSKSLEMSAKLHQIFHQDVLALRSYREALEAEFASGLVVCDDTLLEYEKLLRVANLNNAIGMIFYNSGNFAASNSSFAEVLRIKRDVLQLFNDDSITTTLVNIGHGHYKMKELTNALEAYKEALSVNQVKFCKSDEDFSSALDAILLRFEGRAKQEPNDDSAMLSRNLEELSEILNYIGVVQELNGERREALGTFKRALEIQLLIYNSAGNYVKVAILAEKVGLLQFQSSQYKEALHSFTEALRLKKLISNGKLTVDIAHTMNSIGNVYYSIRELDKSLGIYQQALEIKKDKLGKEHIDVANTLSNIGNVYHAKGDYNEALEAYTLALNLKQKQLGEGHLDVASAYGSIGDIQAKRKVYSNSLEMYEEALLIQVTNLGDTHLENAVTLRNIAKIHQIKGNTKELVKALEKELRIRKTLLGSSHFSLTQPLTVLARSYHELRQLDKALLLYREVLHLLEQRLESFDRKIIDDSSLTVSSSKSSDTRKQHSDVLGIFSDVLEKIGVVCLEKEEIDKALAAFRASLKYKIRQLGENSFEVAKISENVALCLFNKGEYQGAVSSFLDALRVKKLHFGEDSDEVATTSNNLGNVYYTLGDLKKAMEAYAKAFLVKKCILGDDHLDLATMLNNIASIYAEEGENDEAIEAYQEALRIREKRLGDKHLLVASTLINLGDIHLRNMNVDASLDSYNQALRIRALQLGNQDTEVAFVLDKIGNAYAENGEHKRAVEYYFDAAKVREHDGGKESLNYALSVEKIAISQIELGKYDDAMKCLRHVLNVKILKLGGKHDEV